jgi:pimeloyl-[acyl-carrier protein] synthase
VLTKRVYDTEGRGFTWFRRCVERERAASGVVFNPFARSFWSATHDVYEGLRESSPVHFSELLDCWIVTSYRDVADGLLAHRVLKSNPFSSSQELLDPFALLNEGNPSLFMNDPPEHTRLRGIVNDAFGVAAVRALSPSLERCIERIVRSLGERGDQVDLIGKFAHVVPLRALELITGLEIDRVDEVGRWIASIAAAMDPLATMRSATEARDAYAALQSYLGKKSSVPSPPGTLCWSIQRAVESDQLTRAEAQQLVFFIILSGTKTVSDLLASATHHLAQAPMESRQRCRIDGHAVDRLLLEFSPVQMVARTAAADVNLGGKKIRGGQRVLLVLASANCDALKAGPGRGSRKGLPRCVAFGRGIHACVGAYFARVQVQQALSRLMGIFPYVRVADAALAGRGIAFKTWSRMNVIL